MSLPSLSIFAAQTPRSDGRQSETARLIQRGVGRFLTTLGLSILYEVPLASGRRADVLALSQTGDFFIVEIKSSIGDFRADHKWPHYRPYCDRFYFATHTGVPLTIFPEDAGLILADGFGAAIMREAPEVRLASARRKALTLRFAHAAARRIHILADPAIQAMDYSEGMG